ncbi:hypothetical protein H632_c566p1 [Helicosporidium sp. ATCC 50920]|nr:hypothetical protein H632_c566p1 [Helicosporidium sp. ATCC 50920]|eukprot:KDD75654.1 hypothetical protein H632_c566p1 [Helicosporidium sp. ATCC 50920]
MIPANGILSAATSVVRGVARAIGHRASSASAAGLLEIREYTLEPKGIKAFNALTADYVGLRTSLLPLLGFFACDTGGVLNRVVHLYHYRDHDHRDACRRAAAQSQEWQNDYLANSRLHVSMQASSMYVAATDLLTSLGREDAMAAPKASQGGVYELQHYSLAGSVSARAVYDALGASTTDVGREREVVELWRWPSSSTRFQARQSGETALPPGVSSVSSAQLVPVPYSPWQ